ncbi:MAG: AAA family ATPase, partial [Gaiellaceae bacterium]
MTLEQIKLALAERGAKREGNETRFRCPYPDRHRNGDACPSARWNRTKAVWRCDVCGAGGGYVSLARALGIEMEPESRGKVIATYDYRDESDTLLYQVERLEPKRFRQRRPDGKRDWIYKLDGVRRVPYRLPDLLPALVEAFVFIVEGEKDVDALYLLGLVATCNPGGAGKWRAEYNPHLAGRHVVVIPDADEPGRRHADDIVRHLLP